MRFDRDALVEAPTPVIVAGLLLASFGLLPVLLPLDLLFVCVGIGASALAYVVVASWVDPRYTGGDRSVPAPLALGFTVLVPAGIGVSLAALGRFSLAVTILLTALSLVVFSYLFVVPLALYQQTSRCEPTLEAPRPVVSVLVPAYDEEGYVGRCVESILTTDYPDALLDVIVIDDGSDDGTYEEARAYAEEGVRVLRKENGGKHSALNYGLLGAEGDVVTIVDADSLLRSGAIDRIVGIFQSDPEIGAVAGTIEVGNRGSVVTNCQALEYVVGINLFRRALSVLGGVPIVPGALGAYRRSVLDAGGRYDPDTLTEDFDVTVKTLKLGRVVQADSLARAETDAPGTWLDLYRQRLRWYRGNLMTLWKHRNAFLNRRFGALYRLTFPMMAISLLVVPVASVAVVLTVAAQILAGAATSVVGILGFFALLQTLTALLAVEIAGEDRRLAAYAPLLVVGYKQFVDLVVFKSALDVLFRRDSLSWTAAKRLAQSGEETTA